MVQTRSGATYQTRIEAERAEALRKADKRARDESAKAEKAKADEEHMLQKYAFDYFSVHVYPTIWEEKYKAQETNPHTFVKNGPANLVREWAIYQGKAELDALAKDWLAEKRVRDIDTANRIREERNEWLGYSPIKGGLD